MPPHLNAHPPPCRMHRSWTARRTKPDHPPRELRSPSLALFFDDYAGHRLRSNAPAAVWIVRFTMPPLLRLSVSLCDRSPVAGRCAPIFPLSTSATFHPQASRFFHRTVSLAASSGAARLAVEHRATARPPRVVTVASSSLVPVKRLPAVRMRVAVASFHLSIGSRVFVSGRSTDEGI